MADVSTMTQNAQEIPSNVNMPLNGGANQSAPISSAPPPAAGQPSVWKNLAMGALWGLVGAGQSGALSGRGRGGADAFAAGVVGGVGGNLVERPEFQAKQQQEAADIRFKNAQAADLQTQYAIHEAQLNHLPQQYQNELNLQNIEMVKDLESLGLTPVAVTGDNPGDAMATGRNLTKQGGVGNLYTLEVTQGGKTAHLSFDLDKITSGPQGLSLINQAEEAQFGKAVTDPAVWAQMPPAAKVTATNEALHYLNPQITDRKGLDSAKALLTTLQAQGTPQADALAKKYQKAIDAVEPVIVHNEQEAIQRAAAEARQKELATKAADLETPQGKAALEKSVQDTIDAKYKNLQAHQDELLKNGRDPETGETLNLGNAPDEMLIDPATHQPVPTSMIQTIKPTMQERNRADFAESTLHSLNEIDKLRMAGKLPNGPLQGLSTKALVKAGMANGDAQKAMDFISFAQSAATGAHVGGRFNEVIMQKMHDMIGLNMNDSQFSGAEDAIRSVMQQYAEHGGIETVGQYRNGLIGSVKFLPNGQRLKVTGFDKSGNVTGTVVR